MIARALLLLVLWVAPAAARAPTSQAEWEVLGARLDRPTQPVVTVTSIWEALELAAQRADGETTLAPRLARLSTSALPFVAGEATLAGARLQSLHAGAAEVVRLAAERAGVLGSGQLIGPLPGPTSTDALVAATDPRWRSFDGLARPGSLPLADLADIHGDAHLELAFPLVATAPTHALLVVGSNGPVTVWLDGQQLVTHDGEQRFSDWEHAVPVDLTKDQHRLVVRVGHRSVAPQLSLRIVDARGLRPAALGGPAGGKAPGKPLTALGQPADTVRLAVWVGPPFAADADALAAARTLDPVMAARAAPDDESNQRALLEADGGATADALLIDLAAKQGLPADADRFARALTALEPDHPALLAYRALLLLETSDPMSALAVIGDDPRLARNVRLATVQATLLERAERIEAAADAWARVALLQNGDSEPVQRAVGLYRRAKHPERAVATLDEALTRRPYSLDLYILEARTLAVDDPAAGLAVLDRIAPFHVATAGLHETRGRLLLLAGDRGQAVEAFDRALELAPQDRDLSDYRRALVAQGGADTQSVADRFAEPIGPIVAAAKAIAPSQRGATGLFERQVIQVFPSGLSSSFRQVVIRVDNEASTERFQTFQAAFTPGEDRVEIIEAEIIRADGTKLRPEAVQEQRQDGKSGGVYTLQAAKIVRFPALKAGDIMHLQVRTDEIGSRNLFGDFFGAIVPLSNDFPKARAELIVLAPTSRPLAAHTQGVPAFTTKVDGDQQTLTLSASDIPAIQPEPSMPGYGDVGAWASVSTFASWDDMGRWYRQLVKAQLDVPPDLQRLADGLIAALPKDASARDKVAAIHGWVIKNTRYVGIEFGIHGYKPYSVSEIVKRGYGDCKDKASLIVALAHAVHIPMDFVLVRTRDLGRLDGTPATLRAFNHAIAYSPELDLYLDGTAELSGLEELPELDQGAQVLRMDLYGDAAPVLTQIPLQTIQQNTVAARGTYLVKPNGDVSAEYHEESRGSMAGRLRVQLQDPARRDQLLAAIIVAQHPGTIMRRTGFSGLDVPGQPVVIEAAVELPALGVVRGPTMTIPLVLEPGQKLATFGTLATRRYPLILPSLETETSIDVYTPPPGWSATVPAPIKLTSPFGELELTAALKPEGVVVTQRYVPLVARVEPADYPAYRQFLAAMARAEAATLVLTRATP